MLFHGIKKLPPLLVAAGSCRGLGSSVGWVAVMLLVARVGCRTGKGGARCGAAGVLAHLLHASTRWLLDSDEMDAGRIETLELAGRERLA